MLYMTGHKSLLSVLLLLLLSSPSLAISLYKWVDTEGRVSYQDRPPPAGQVFEEKTITDKAPDPTSISERAPLPVVLYFTGDCPACDRVRNILQSNQVAFIQHLIDYNSSVQQELKRLAGTTNVPALSIGGRLVTHLDRISLESSLRAAGYARQVRVVD